MKNKKIKPKNKPEASVVFAEIESKLPEGLVLKSIKTKTGIAVYTKYFVKTRPYYIKKQYKTLSGGKKKLEYSFYDVFYTIFQGASGKIQEGHQKLIKTLNIQNGTDIYEAICCDVDSEPDGLGFEEEETTSAMQVGIVDIDLKQPRKTNKTKEQRLQNKIETLRRFTEYAGVTPSVYFKYFNYKMHEFFRSDEDNKFIVKYCLKYSQYGARLDSHLESIYYNRRNFFLKLAQSSYSTLIPFIINSYNTFGLKCLVELGLHKNTLYKNSIINKCIVWNQSKHLLESLSRASTGAIYLIIDSEIRNKNIPVFISDWINYEKQHNKVPYKTMNVDALYEKYVTAIDEIRKLLIFPEISKKFPVKNIHTHEQCYNGDNNPKVRSPDGGLKVGKLTITKNLTEYINAFHNVNTDFVIKDIIEAGKHGVKIDMFNTDLNTRVFVTAFYEIEIEE